MKLVDQLGKMVMQDDRENSVRVYITGERKIVNSLTSSDVRGSCRPAAGSVYRYRPCNDPHYSQPVQDTSRGISEVSPQNLSVHLEKKVTKEFGINVTSDDSKPTGGWRLLKLPQIRKKVRYYRTGIPKLVR